MELTSASTYHSINCRTEEKKKKKKNKKGKLVAGTFMYTND
jgi:hypothetical protein